MRRRILTIGVGASLVARAGIPAGFVKVDDATLLRYLPSWELDLRHQQPDTWVRSQSPSKAGRTLIAQTLTDDALEMDAEGRVVANGVPMAGALVAVGNATDEVEGEFAIGACLGMLLALRRRHAFHFTVYATSPIVWIFEPPTTLADVPVMDGWLRAAHLLVGAPRSIW